MLKILKKMCILLTGMTKRGETAESWAPAAGAGAWATRIKRGSGSRTDLLAYSFLANRPVRRKSDPSQRGYPDVWIAPVDWERNGVLNFLDGRQQLTVKAAENVAKGLALVWVRVDLQGLALQGQHEDAPAL